MQTEAAQLPSRVRAALLAAPFAVASVAALILHQLLLSGAIPTLEQTEHIVDNVVLPLLQVPIVAA